VVLQKAEETSTTEQNRIEDFRVYSVFKLEARLAYRRNPGLWRGYSVMVFNTTFNNILIISWRSVLLMEESGVPGENLRPAASQWQTSVYNG